MNGIPNQPLYFLNVLLDIESGEELHLIQYEL